MSKYFPDNWVVLKSTLGDETSYKVLGGWSGSFTWGDSWRLNSGIVKVDIGEKYITFHGHSGSEYVCHKNSYELRMNNGGICKQILEEFPDTVEMMDKNTDWANLV